MPLHVSSTCAHHQEVKIALHSLWYHHTYRYIVYITVINELDAQHFCFTISLFHASTCFEDDIITPIGVMIPEAV